MKILARMIHDVEPAKQLMVSPSSYYFSMLQY